MRPESAILDAASLAGDLLRRLRAEGDVTSARVMIAALIECSEGLERIGEVLELERADPGAIYGLDPEDRASYLQNFRYVAACVVAMFAIAPGIADLPELKIN